VFICCPIDFIGVHLRSSASRQKDGAPLPHPASPAVREDHHARRGASSSPPLIPVLPLRLDRFPDHHAYQQAPRIQVLSCNTARVPMRARAQEACRLGRSRTKRQCEGEKPRCPPEVPSGKERRATRLDRRPRQARGCRSPCLASNAPRTGCRRSREDGHQPLTSKFRLLASKSEPRGIAATRTIPSM